MPFPEFIANGLYLVIPALRSPNYVAGTSGWTLNQDGTVEFAAATIRGSLLVVDPDGSQVHIFDENPGNGAVIDLTPATVPGHTITTPARLRHALNGSNRPVLTISSAVLDGQTPGAVMQLYSDELAGNQAITLWAPNITLNGRLFGAGSGTGVLDLQNMNLISVHNSELLFDTLGDLVYTLPTPSGTTQRVQGQGIIGVSFYTGGTGATSAGATEVALPAWTTTDGPFRFVNGHKYSAEIGGGCFTSLATPSPTEMASVRLRSAVNSTAAQVLGSLQVPTPAGASVASWARTIYFKNVSGANVDKTSFGLTIARAAGTGNAGLFGNAAPGPTGPLYCIIRDEGVINETALDSMIIGIT